MRHDMGCSSAAVSHDIRLFGTRELLVPPRRGTLALTSRAACMDLCNGETHLQRLLQLSLS